MDCLEVKYKLGDEEVKEFKTTIPPIILIVTRFMGVIGLIGMLTLSCVLCYLNIVKQEGVFWSMVMGVVICYTIHNLLKTTLLMYRLIKLRNTINKLIRKLNKKDIQPEDFINYIIKITKLNIQVIDGW